MQKRLLIVEDDTDIRELLQRCLISEGYAVTARASGRELAGLLTHQHHDLALIDINVTDPDGLMLTQQLRTRFAIGIIIISSRAELNDRIAGLDMGADDYLIKPFAMTELYARIRSVLRRQDHALPVLESHMQFDGWTLDTSSRTLRDEDGHAVALTCGEYRLLETLARRAGRVLSRAQLLDEMHDNDDFAFDRSIDVAIMRLRRKLGDGGPNARLIKTVRGGGYIFAAKISS